MKLTYRGTDYEYNPLDGDTVLGKDGGKYRGAIWRFHYVKHENIPQFAADLKYRGVAYHVGETLQTDKAVEVASTQATPDTTIRLHRTHLTNLRRNLEHRLAIAKANGDESLVSLLQEEANQLVL
ncbi:hypothetical protein NIES4101_41270 [Calothrix sp. NIES-4101]|nr:hypothetical protein NIES4101_41270 [Calothrix sp. NIES-4101]